MRLTQVAGINPNGMAGAALTNLAKISKGPYNTASYANTQKYNSEKKFIFYGEMRDTLKGNELYSLLASQSAQAVLRLGEVKLVLLGPIMRVERRIRVKSFISRG